MDAFTDRDVTDIVIMSSAQVGKSETLFNVIGYIMDQDPSPILMLQPTLEMAEAVSKDRIAPMLRDTPALSGLVKDARSRESGNTLLHKQFPGGHLTLAGANSPASLASRPIRVVLADEVDRYPISAGTEGDPLSLAEKRTLTFSNKKKVKVSTPTVKGASRIEAAYQQSDMRRFYVPCAHCGEKHTLQWANVKWPEGKPQEAIIHCPHCGAGMTDAQRIAAIREGEWIGSAPFTGIAGFHISELYSPWRVLPDIVTDFLAAKDYPERLKTWVNTSLGETWEEAATSAIKPHVLAARAEDYKLGTVPAGVGVVTGAVDTQGDRLEYYVWGFGEGEEAWVLDRQVLYGDPAHSVVWQQLLEVLDRPLIASGGAPIVPRVVAIDSGGLHTQIVYNFCRSYALRRTANGLQQIIAIKGQAQSDKAILGKPTDQDLNFRGQRIPKGVKLWPIGSSAAKSLLYGRFKIENPGPGYVHFSAELPEDFYDQLTSEKLMTKYVRGFGKLEWQIEKGRRNEALDCAVYAYAAAIQMGMSRWRAADFARLRERMHVQVNLPAAPSSGAPADQPPTPGMAKPAKRRQAPRSNWVTGWK